jgi:hypothetical protein
MDFSLYYFGQAAPAHKLDIKCRAGFVAMTGPAALSSANKKPAGTAKRVRDSHLRFSCIY